MQCLHKTTQVLFHGKISNRQGTQAAQAIIVRSYYYFFNLYVNVQHVKRDIVTAVIYCYITTEFHYAKHGLAYGGVMYGEKR